LKNHSPSLLVIARSEVRKQSHIKVEIAAQNTLATTRSVGFGDKEASMFRSKKVCTIAIVIAAAVMGVKMFTTDAFGQKKQPPADKDRAAQLMKDGNYKEAYDIYSALALDPKDDPQRVADDMAYAMQCLRNLGRNSEFDGFIEKVIKTHKDNWRLLSRAAQLYIDAEHYGSMIAGEFVRGPHRGSSVIMNSFERDRVRSMQLYRDAIEKNAKGPDSEKGSYTSNLYTQYFRAILGNRGWSEAWRLQYLTDLSVLPDYDEGHYYGDYYSGTRGAPVNPDGTPVFHRLPRSWEAATTDGERFRWCMMQAIEYSPSYKGSVLIQWADFLCNQFGVATMSEYRGFFRTATEDDTKKNESGPYAVHTLGEDETIAKLVNGIKRFKLPDEFNYIKTYKEIADKNKSGYAEDALNKLASIFENRMQYDRAAEYWHRSISQFGDRQNWKQNRLDQIVKNWGQFQPVVTQPAGYGATVEYRFRNGRSVNFTAREVNVHKILADLKEYIKDGPKTLDWEKVNIQDIGYRLVTKKQEQYVGNQVAAWELVLEPRPRHFDRCITVTTPLQKPGAYLLTAKMSDGNTSNIIIWVADTAIVKKSMDNGTYYFVADAVTGLPVAKANLEFFGYWQKWRENRRSGEARYDILTRQFAEFADADGQFISKPQENNNRYQWLITATTKSGRFAYLGFTGAWYGRYYDYEYNQTKYYFITDRPVYRPEQSVNFKWWVNTAKYDQEGKSPFAGNSFTVRIHDPRGEKVFEKNYTADEYGGIDGVFPLAKDVTLGQYRVTVNHSGAGSFRVEEYKKPEFEVRVSAPDKPVMLGEKISAKIEAKYYFGAPVTEAKVKYKILRYGHSADWYPPLRWDWFYGRGYGWFGYDYVWYPGWNEWGCVRPWPWWRHRPQGQPELVAEVEAPIGNDGIVKVEIDTAPAKAMLGDMDHRYEITAEVTDRSRRTITGKGMVIVARKPFKVYVWTGRGHYRVGDVVRVQATGRTPDGRPVQGRGILRLLRVKYSKGEPVETEVQRWNMDTGVEGSAVIQIKASTAGQYRLSYNLTDAEKHTIEGGYVFCVTGQGIVGADFRFDDIELVPDKTEYAPGEKVNLMININRSDGCVLLFVRPANGVCLPPKVIRMQGKSVQEEIEVMKKDMPNFFVEAVTVSGGKVFQEMRELAVPPKSRVLNVSVEPSASQYRPGEKGTLKFSVTDATGEPYSGSLVVTMYDKAVEYISGGSNVTDIKEFFWKWRRHHNPVRETSLDRGGYDISDRAMGYIGVFGHLAQNEGMTDSMADGVSRGGDLSLQAVRKSASAPMSAVDEEKAEIGLAFDKRREAESGGVASMVEPTIRTQFADTALWTVGITTDKQGKAEVQVKMPENLTTWKTRVWAMGAGSRVGEGTAEVVTTKNLIIRLQAPRFFVQKDEVVLSANVHNYLKTAKKVDVILEMEGGCLAMMQGSKMKKTITVDAGGEKRVDWRVKVIQPGTAVVRMKALTDEESDAMQMTFPAYVHGMLKTESWSGYMRPGQEMGSSITFTVPAERRPEQTRLEVRYSPTLAAAMVDALPYMADYPYGCTEQTLNRFLPAVITQKVLLDMGLNLKDIQDKRTNLNAQEIGTDTERAKQWKRFDVNPVFDEEELRQMVKAGVTRLTVMQYPDGGWGWFSGWGERSWPHTTAVVVHGLQVATANDVAIVPGVLERGVEWLKKYQAEQVVLLKNAEKKKKDTRWKSSADNLDAFVYMVLVDAKADNVDMRNFLYRDRNNLSVYARAMFGLALHNAGDTEKRDMLIRNVSQYVVQDDENQTAYLRMPEGNWWWYWYGSEIEANAYYLKLLAATDPKNQVASRMVKYLLNNRKHSTYWNSTRDTALVIEAFADYLKASGEDKPDMTLTILLDGSRNKPIHVKINKNNLFTYDNKLVLVGDELSTGKHTVEFLKKGTGPLYFNAYLTNFTLEDPITKAGLEIKVTRKYYKLVRVDKTIKAEGMMGQVLDQKVEKYRREELANLATLKSGDLVEIELKIESKNDYEYIMFEDMKAAGFEPVEVQSGYIRSGMRAYMELRDERVCFFTRILPRGTHSVSYRMRAEIPGRFSALPTRASAMYAPELKANSDELKLYITD
jgi:alpha-2-macroglobulin